MTALTDAIGRLRAAVSRVLSYRPTRTIIAAALLPALARVALEATSLPWGGYTLEVALAGLGILGALIGWYSVQTTPNVVSIDVSGELSRDVSPFDEKRADVDGVVDTIEDLQDAHEDDDKPAQALLLTVNTPGGPVGASSDLYDALDDFDGPSIAVADDLCASGGYMAAAACDQVLASEHSLVGSIGVIGSTLNYHDLLADHGIVYEDYTAGDLKDAGHPAAETDAAERAYRQEIVDTFMGQFVERVAAGRSDLDEDAVRDLEAGVYVGPEAVDVGLIDDLGDEEDAREWLADQLGTETADLDVRTTSSLRPTTGLPVAERIAFAAGQGVASVLADRLPDPQLSYEFRFKR